MSLMTMEQYNRLREAKREGNDDLAKQIEGEEYGVDSTIVDVEIEPLVLVIDFESVESDKSAGLSNSEIATKYGVSTQKINAIIKKGA